MNQVPLEDLGTFLQEQMDKLKKLRESIDQPECLGCNRKLEFRNLFCSKECADRNYNMDVEDDDSGDL